MIISIALLAAFGFAVSLYGFLIEEKIKRDSRYKPACDISDKMSCIKPMMSPWGHLLGVSNTLVGMIFYVAIFVLAWLHYTALIFYLSLVSVAVSVFLAYILFKEIRTFCIICSSTYAINGLLLVFSYLNW